MIAVNLRQSYPDVLKGERTLAEATLGRWSRMSDEALGRFGDLVIGVLGAEVVSAYDVTGWHRDEAGRVIFEGELSKEFGHLVGGASPVKPWVQGQARPIQYVDTAILRGGEAEVEELPGNVRRALVKGYYLTVDADGIATVEPPRGGTVTVVAPNPDREAI